MTARRIGAVLAAVVLIAAAFLVRRNVLDDDDADAEPPGGTAVDTTAAASASGAVICITELAAACAAIDEAQPELSVTVEPAGTTLDRLAVLADGDEVPVWLTVAPFPTMVDLLRDAAGLTPLRATGDVIAATPLAVATPVGGRAGVLATGCEGAPLWLCLGEHASEPWTDLGGEAGWHTVRPSLGLVEQEGAALASFAAAVAGYLGTPSVTKSAWDADPAFVPWLRQLAGAVDPSALSGGSPLNTMVTRPSALDVAATTAAEQASVDADGDGYDASYPEPSMWLEAVLAVPEGSAVPDDVVRVATNALAAWEPPSAVTQAVPGASTMLALRALWQEAA